MSSNPSEISRNARLIDSLAKEVTKEKKSLEKEIKNSKKFWEGEASNQFRSTNEQVLHQIQSLSNEIVNLKDTMNRLAKEVNRAIDEREEKRRREQWLAMQNLLQK